MTPQRIALSLLLGCVSLAGVAADCEGTRCSHRADSPSQPCTPSTRTSTHIQLPDTVWQSLKRGQGQRLPVTLDVTDLSAVSRARQLAEYENQKKNVLQALPRDGVRLLRSFDQLPLLDIEISTVPALRALLLQCLVVGVFAGGDPGQRDQPVGVGRDADQLAVLRAKPAGEQHAGYIPPEQGVHQLWCEDLDPFNGVLGEQALMVNNLCDEYEAKHEYLYQYVL